MTRFKRVCFWVKWWLIKIFGGLKVASVCYHATNRASAVKFSGRKLFLIFSKDFEYCIDCMSSMAIPCAYCKRPIFPGDPVTLYVPEVPPSGLLYNGSPIGCIHCAEMGLADAMGKWVAPGTVKIVPFDELVDFQIY